MFRLEFADSTGVTKIDFRRKEPAFQIADALRSADDIDEVQIWEMDKDDGEDAEVIYDWKP